MAFIKAMAYCLPESRLTNAELVARFGEKAVQSIIKMAGVKERRVVAEGETASDLACRAAQRLFAEHGVDPKTIDLLIFTSQTGDYQIPATACVLHERLGLGERCACFDMGLGCSAFPFSLSVANGLLATGVASRALLLNADALTQVIHPQDRGLVPLHGDAAVATLMESTPGGGRLAGFYFGTDGSGWKHLVIPVSGARRKRDTESAREVTDDTGSVTTAEHLQMNGPAVFHFSMHKVPEAIKAALAQWHWAIADCQLVLLHQANRTMVDMIYRLLRVPVEKQFHFVEEVGNASGASSPMLLAEAYRQGRIKSGDKIVLAAFGAGLSWSVVGIEWA
ncbi:MAG: ketoacyl-ACP synthase III [Verrucomicrobiota bacterium]